MASRPDGSRTGQDPDLALRGSGVRGVIRSVVFDVGETLVDESRAWGELADAAVMTKLTLFAVLGALI
jgi:hypothetical protein